MELIFPETHHTQHRVVRMFVSEQQKRYHTRHLNLTLKHINIIVPESAIAIAIDCCNILCITTWFSTPSENP
jgi:Uri superfamily endonuclease